MAGDQSLVVRSIPASAHQDFGILSDCRDLMKDLDREAEIISRKEEEAADEAAV